MNADDASCSALAEAGGVPLVATAPEETDAWLLLESAGAWPAKILDGPSLPPAVVDRLRAFEERLPNGRVQYVRRPRRPVDTPALFFGRSGRTGGWLRWMEIPAYEALLNLDLEGIVEGTAPAPGTPWSGPLVLVCVHGKRDRCCALHGGAAYRAFEAQAPGAVWQTSHLGGHRFAPTIAVLPDGLYLGRVRPDEVPGLLGDLRAGRLPPLDRVRGRAGQPAAAQAAEHFLREATGERRLDAMSVVALETLAADRWSVTLARAGDPATHRLEVALESGEPLLPASCGKGPTPTTRFCLVAHRS